jgi:hypothetical protein
MVKQEREMRHLWTTLTLVALIFAAAPAAAGSGDILGKWSAKKMEAKGKTQTLPKGLEIMVVFDKGGKFSAIMKAKGQEQVKKGKWSMKKDVITTVVDGKTEKMRYSVDGSKLTLVKLPGKQRMYLEKVK